MASERIFNEKTRSQMTEDLMAAGWSPQTISNMTDGRLHLKPEKPAKPDIEDVREALMDVISAVGNRGVDVVELILEPYGVDKISRLRKGAYKDVIKRARQFTAH